MKGRGGRSPVSLVLLGAGHAHLEVLRAFGRRPEPGVRLTLVTQGRHTPYSGMLPGLIAGHYGFDQAHVAVEPLARWAGTRLVIGTANGLDPADKLVRLADGTQVAYDLLSIDVGGISDLSIAGAAAHAIPVKPIDGFRDRFEALRARVLDMRVLEAGDLHVAMVGAGAGGVELILAMRHRLSTDLADAGRPANRIAMTLISRDPEPLPGFPDRLRRRFTAILAEAGIALRAPATVASVADGGVLFTDGSTLAADAVFWATEAGAQPWLAEIGLPLDGRGFILVDATLRASESVFAAGDTAAFRPRPLPKSGVYAVRAGQTLADNLRRVATGRELRPFRPQRTALYLISAGPRHALGTRNGIVVEGDWVWRLKSWIDRRFVARFRDPGVR